MKGFAVCDASFYDNDILAGLVGVYKTKEEAWKAIGKIMHDEAEDFIASHDEYDENDVEDVLAEWTIDRKDDRIQYIKDGDEFISMRIVSLEKYDIPTKEDK